MPQTRMRALVNTFFAAFNAGDTSKLSQLVTEDIVIEVNQDGPRSGREAFLAVASLLRLTYNERVCSLRVLVAEDGQRAAAEYTVSSQLGMPPFGTGRQVLDGATYQLRAGSFFEFRGERICRITTYYNQPDRVLEETDVRSAA